MGAVVEEVAAPPTRVADVLGWAEGLRLVGRAVGLDRRVRWAQASDLPDPAPFLRGSELVLVAGLSLPDDAACERFVAALRPVEPAAIGYAVGVVHDVVPEALVRAANRIGVPVFEIPTSVPFILFTERLAQESMRVRERRENGHLLELVRAGRARPDAVLDRAPLFADADDLRVVGMSPEQVPALPPGGPLVADLVGASLLVSRDSAPAPGFPADLVCGVSGRGALADLPRLIGEALEAWELARRRSARTTAADLASLTALAQRLPESCLHPFREYLRRPIEVYDRRHGAGLRATLEELIRCDGSVTTCARNLFLHPNTVRKRLKRVHALTGKDPVVPVHLAELALALRG
ncbi:PucR family transcriptional regulator [Saccharopolyspora flava]|uniref:PucR C-terminal helix-turn-helix domain-containing protein n=1 Tax=Saccharopolyspora flava TaxID=95161 RepID=A0A1I6SPD9_9PSEU|nr:PucR family transcriptional regulator [Saccharopolyspora flava]SFS78823.1 PucR C-terminal helix-turn-helix domain-containing protein [Saccharopolyspora flava]